jgi:alpha-amylase
MKNYKLSDDIAFRFGNRGWKEWPLTADKFSHWLSETSDADIFNLFMDYETFGEHQWGDSGIFDFLRHLPAQWLENDNHTFMTVSEAIDTYDPVGQIDVPQTTTWADTERDLSAWLGNPMQTSAIRALYELQTAVIKTRDLSLIEDWRKLQTSDHFYYMCTKWFSDGDIHAYFSPYANPYEAFTNFMNAYHDLKFRLAEAGADV